jgi:hypothetical protein
VTSAPTTPEPCALCGGPLSPPAVPVRGGRACHLACAERAATAAWRRRRLLARGHLGLLLAALGGLALWAGPSPALLAAALAWAALHGTIHHRYWQFTIRDLRRAHRRRGKQRRH